MAGTSMFGRAATGNRKKATVPARSRPRDRRIVAMGRAMNGAETFMAQRKASGSFLKKRTKKLLVVGA
jgi:hypothetical protein